MPRTTRYLDQGIAAITFALGIAAGLIANDPHFRTWVLIGCAVVVVFGVVSLMRAWILKFRGPIMQWERYAGRASVDPSVTADWSWLSTDEELAQYQRLVDADMPEHGYPTVEKLRERLRANNKLVMGVYEISHGQRRLEACMVAYPLRQQALDYFLDGTYTNAQPITRRDVAASWPQARGIYIALLVGSTWRSKGRIKQDLQRFIELQSDLPVLARPATDDGFRTVRGFGMQPLSTTSEVWLLSPATSTAVTQQKRAATPVG